METWDAVTSRRNVRTFEDRPVPEEDLARDLLGFPGDRFCAFLLSIGYPGDGPLRPIKNPTRRDFDDVVHRETW